ncbi:MAG: hypothetical protein KAU94_00630 [Verrucomicrobia bacterium]|nr:hypothetical protein [Verrucomicrobiota bacterium]
MPDENTIRSILGSQTDDKSVVSQAILKVLSEVENPSQKCDLLAIALVERNSVPKVPKSLPNIGLADDIWDQLTKIQNDMVNGHLKMAFFKSQTAKDFAVEILRLVDFFPSEDEKTFALAKALFSPYIPFHQLPGTPIHMTVAEFRQKLASEKDRLELIEYIIELPFDEYTERASMLLQVLEDTPDEDVRVALLAAAWQRHEKKIVEYVENSK